MVKDESNLKDNQCPKCKFAGTDSDIKKFSAEKINRYPKGYAPENRPRIKINKIAGQEVQEFVRDEKTNEIIFDKVRRCPPCGFTEGDKL